MMFESMMPSISTVQVRTTHNRGFTPEEIAEQCADKIIYVGENSHPVIREQAHTFRQQIKTFVLLYIKEAISNDRSSIATKLRESGYSHLITLLEK